MKKLSKNCGLKDNMNSFKVPEGYFESFAANIESSIERKELKKRGHYVLPDTESVRTSFWMTMRPYLYMAAMFVGLMLISNVFFLSTRSESTVSVQKQLMQLQEEAVKSSTNYIKTKDMYKKYLQDQAVEASFLGFYDSDF